MLFFIVLWQVYVFIWLFSHNTKKTSNAVG
ncbi:hypothetical protein [Escherichia coli]